MLVRWLLAMPQT